MTEPRGLNYVDGVRYEIEDLGMSASVDSDGKAFQFRVGRLTGPEERKADGKVFPRPARGGKR